MIIGILSLLIANFLGGAILPLFIKLGVKEMPPILFTTLRFVIAFLLILPLYLKSPDLKITRKNLKLVLVISILFTVNVGLFSIGIQYTNVIIGQMLYAFVPVMVAFLGYFIFKEKITKHNTIGSLIAFSGLIFLISQSFSGQGNIFGSPLGNIIIMMAVFSWSFYILFSKKIADSCSERSIGFANFLISATLLSFLIPFEQQISPYSFLNVSQLGIISLVAVGISSVAFINLLQIGIKKTGAFIASLFSYTGPLFAAITAIPLLGEKITPNLVFGGLLILAGVFYATGYDKLRQKYG